MTTKTKLVKRQSSVLLPERDIDKSPVLECVGLGAVSYTHLTLPTNSRV